MRRIGEKAVTVFAWPGFKLVKYCGLAKEGGNAADGLMSAIFGIPVFLFGTIVFWTGLIAVVGNLIVYLILGHL